MATTDKIRVTCTTDSGNEKSFNFSDPASTVTRAQINAAFNPLLNFSDRDGAGDRVDGLLMFDSDTALTAIKSVEKIITSTTELT